MSLNIKREETCQLAAELAGLTGENRTEAITRTARALGTGSAREERGGVDP